MLAVAVLPTIALLLGLWWLDRYDREPLWMFVLAVSWGATGGVAVALAGDAALADPLARLLGLDDATWLSTVVLAPLIEEPGKAVVLFLVVRAARFEGTTDGFVYGAATGLGFGLTENLRVFSAAAQGGGEALLVALLGLRTLYSALMHATASSCVGAALGFVKFRGGRGRQAVPLALLLAIGIHALWNGLLAAAITGHTGLGLLDLALFPIESGLLLLLFRLSLADERTVLRRELAEEVDLGVLPAPHYEYLAAYARRARPGWLPACLDGRLYIRSATALAFRKHQLQVGAEPGHYADEVTRLRRALVQQLGRAGLAPDHIPALERSEADLAAAGAGSSRRDDGAATAG